jgi:NAD(P)-dependent dehydrogenase (short-subunit alcohol dehydrogenase family)
MDLKDKKIVVTGGSRGLGLGVTEALVAQGAKVTVVARGAAALAELRHRLGVETVAADITEPATASRILGEVRPDVLILNAGATPGMATLDEISWADFSGPWETDVKAGLFWLQAALKPPMAADGRVLVVSSGAAVDGSPMSGGYAGAKRMLWLMANYANAVAQQKGLGVRFQTVIPRQMILAGGVGAAGAEAYSKAHGITPEQFVARFGAPMPPRDFGDKLVSILVEPEYAKGVTFGLKGDTGITILEGAAA